MYSGWPWNPSLLKTMAAIQDRSRLPENAGCGASASSQLGGLCSLLGQAIRVSGRLPRGLARAHPGCRWPDGEGSEETAVHRRTPVGAPGKPNRRLRMKQLLQARESTVLEGADRLEVGYAAYLLGINLHGSY